MTSAITPGVTTGRWRIVTQGSVHIWDLDEMTWVRHQQDGLNPMEIDEEVQHIRFVMRWPQVGSTFYVITNGRWHQSSTIRSIEPLPKDVTT